MWEEMKTAVIAAGAVFGKAMAALSIGAFLALGSASESDALGIDLDADLRRGNALVVLPAFDGISNPNGAAALELFTGIFMAGGRSDGNLVNINEATDGSFTLNVLTFDNGTSSQALFGSADGSASTRVFMEDTSSPFGDQDLMEFLFSISVNDNSLTNSSLVIASLLGEFGSDPFGDSGPTSLLPGGFSGAEITLTAVSQVPLPASVLLLMSAIGGLGLLRKRSI